MDVFKLCNIFTFRSLVEELILKRKIDSQTGTKTEKLLFSPQCERFHKIWWKSQEKVMVWVWETFIMWWQRCVFLFLHRVCGQCLSKHIKASQTDCSFDNAIVILWMSSKRNMNATLKLVVVLLTRSASPANKASS